MKYLKIFEEYTKELFEEISQLESETLLHEYPCIPLSKFETDRMIQIFNRWKDRKDISYKIVNYTDTNRPGSMYLEYGGRFFGHEVTITKLEDGWFLLDTIPRDAYTFAIRNNRTYESYRKFFKCDQFEGVISFLNNKFSTNVEVIPSTQ